MTTQPALVWFRLDLRLTDNPALMAAVERAGPVIPVYIWAPKEEGSFPPGGASLWWLHQSLAGLQTALGERGSRLIVRRGPAWAALSNLISESGAKAVFWKMPWNASPSSRNNKRT